MITPRPRGVNIQLISFQPVGILIACVLFEIFDYLFKVSPVSVLLLLLLLLYLFIIIILT